MTEPTSTPPVPTVWHGLSYDDAPAAVDFLTSAFGFVAKAVYYEDEAKSRVAHAQLEWPPGGGVMLGSAPRPDGWPDIRGRGSAYCVVESEQAVDELFARATAAGPGPPRAEGRGLRRADLRRPGPGGQRVELRQLPRRVTPA